MQEDLQNKNLFVAKKILEMITNKTVPMDMNRVMELRASMIPGLSSDEIRGCLKALERRKAIRFVNEDDIYDQYNDPISLDIILDKVRIREFTKIAKNILYGIHMENKEQIREILETLYTLTNSKLDKDDQVKLSKIGFKHAQTLEWIADYSGIIKVIYELEADFNHSEGRTRLLGARENPKAVRIMDRRRLEGLHERIRGKVGGSYKQQIDFLLDNKKEIEWRCVNCGRFLDRLTSQKQIINYLNDFIIHKFRICYKCRERNYFSITPAGGITFVLYTRLLPKRKKYLRRYEEPYEIQEYQIWDD